MNHQLGDMEQCEAAISDLRNQCQVIQKMPHLMGKVAAAPEKAVCHEYQGQSVWATLWCYY